jgi:hypothetical protein
VGELSDETEAMDTEGEDDVVARIQKLAEPTQGEASGSGFKKFGGGQGAAARSRIDRMDHTLRKIIKKGKKDNQEFAALNEKVDKLENEKRRDSLIVLLPRDFPKLEAPVENDFKFEQRKEVVEQLFERFMDDKEYTIESVRHLNPARMGRQLCEVKFSSAAEAGRIRKTFVQKVRNQENLKDATINLNQSPATRVRIEIMKIIANRIGEENPEGSAIVVPHLAKPVIVLYDKDGRKRPLSYLQAVKSYKNLLTDSDVRRISEKMSRIGFEGSPEHVFAVIEEVDSEDERYGQETEDTTSKGYGNKKGFSTKSTAGKRSYAEMASSSKGAKISKPN